MDSKTMRRSALEALLTSCTDVDLHPTQTVRPGLSSAPPDDLSEGLTLGATLGVGGMGVVRLATQHSVHRAVAVKTVRPEVTRPEAVRALLREGWITGALEHPNIVPVHDIKKDDEGRPLVVLKRIEGVPWSELIHQPGRVEARFSDNALEWNLRVLMQVSNAVYFAHSRGVVHRDLKPENVMIGSFGEVYLVDWGIAVATKDDGSRRMPLATDVRGMAGTPCYLAPEMLGGREPGIGPWTDVYLLGGILFELLVGRPPHQGETLREIIRSVLDGPAFPDTQHLELQRVALRALEFDPGGRFESAMQFRLALQGFLQHQGSRRLSQQAAERLEELRAAIADADQFETMQRQRIRVHALLSEARFGYRAALAAWAENPKAAEGERDAVFAAAAYDLASGDPQSAARLIAPFADPPADLAQELKERLAHDRLERERLTRLERDHDDKAGRKTRLLFGLSVAAFWTLAPAFADFSGLHARMEIPGVVGVSAASAALVVVIGLALREHLAQSLVNARFFWSLLFAFGAQTALSIVGGILDMPQVMLEVVHFVVWFAVASMVAITVERRFWPTAIGYLLGFFLSATMPDYRVYWMSCCNLVLALNLFYVWRAPRETATPS